LRPWPSVTRGDGAEVRRSAVLELELRVDGSLLRFDEPGRGPLLLRREVLERWQSAEQRAQAAEQALAELRQHLQEQGRQHAGREDQV
jgi:hypothetical protein